MSELPAINWDDAERVGLELVTAGPSVSAAERAQIVRQLRDLAPRAAGIITEASGLPESGQANELVVDRRTILRANVATARQVLSEVGAEPGGPLAAAAGRARGASLGAVLALVSSRVLGQFDPFGTEPTLYLVAPTIMGVERQLGVRPADFRMWVVLHEQTHAVQLANAPWLRDHLISCARGIIESADEPVWHDIGSRLDQFRADRQQGRPASLVMVNALSSPQTVAAVNQVTAVMSLLEGHADLMMDRAGRAVIPSVATIRARFDARRARGGIVGLLNKLMGMDAKLAQYADGARFCRNVVREGGVDLLNRGFSAPEALPSLDELLHPEQWCERVGRHGQT